MAIALLLILGGGAYLAMRHFGHPSELDLAEKAIERRDFKAAREHIEKHRAANPNDREVLLLAARTARRDDDLLAAAQLLRDYEAAIAATDESRLEADLLTVQSGSSRLTSRLLEECRADPDSPATALKLEAIIRTTLNVICPEYGILGPINEADAGNAAIRDARSGLDLWFQRTLSKPDRTQGHLWRARARELSGDHSGAIEDVNAALRLEPDHPYGLFLAANIRRQEAPAEALAILEAAAIRWPDEPHLTILRSVILRETGSVDQARTSLDRLLEREPKMLGALIVRGQIALDLDRAEEAERFLRRALDLAPRDEECLETLSRCMRRLGRTDEAARYHEQFLIVEQERARKN